MQLQSKNVASKVSSLGDLTEIRNEITNIKQQIYLLVKYSVFLSFITAIKITEMFICDIKNPNRNLSSHTVNHHSPKLATILYVTDHIRPITDKAS